MDWEARTRGRLQPTNLQLKSYSGDQLPIVKQIKVCLSREGFSTVAWVQMQQDAPVEFLLGTDLQALLGFRLMQLEANSTSQSKQHRGKSEGMPAVKGLPSQEAATKVSPVVGSKQKGKGSKPMEGESSANYVCLIRGQSIPSRFHKMVKAEVSGKVNHSSPTSLFCPDESFSLLMEDAVVDTQGTISLVVTNPHNFSVDVDKERCLGTIQPVLQMDPAQCIVPHTAEETHQGNVGPSNSERLKN